jgi:pantoate--beta-alanine ligase
MGALHEGHLALVRQVRALTDRACISLFVNPTQFGPNEDYTIYPRDESSDAAKLTALGADMLFAPDAEEMYPEGAATRVSVTGLADMLEGEHRPGFFTGVATIVCKLLLQVLPDIAVFGEKDYQQLLVIRRMVTDLWIPTRIEAVPTVREADGLALSSRNAYLTPEQRQVAPTLHRTLDAVASGVASGADAVDRAEWGEAELLRAGFDAVDYVTVRDAETLALWPGPTRPGRVLAAARLGSTRLIDNVPLG